jgi:formylglycine-generating enzyme required for sulfatase activity
MSGNVQEWCWNTYAYLGTVRVLRGGSWQSIAENCTVADRRGSVPSHVYNDIGFRVVSP